MPNLHHGNLDLLFLKRNQVQFIFVMPKSESHLPQIVSYWANLHVVFSFFFLAKATEPKNPVVHFTVLIWMQPEGLWVIQKTIFHNTYV